MIIGEIIYSARFLQRFNKLPDHIARIAVEKEKIFKTNPLHPSLRLHPLKGSLEGRWSISINKSYRIIFRRLPGGDILFLSIGKHDIYKYL